MPIKFLPFDHRAESIPLEDFATRSTDSSEITFTTFTSSKESRPKKLRCVLRQTAEHTVGCFVFILAAGAICAGVVYYQELNNPCLSSPCLNNSTCERIPGNLYRCVCPEGLYGKFCDNQFNECRSDPCQNNGTCVDQIYGWACECPRQWHGQVCQHRVTPCTNEPCENQAQCEVINDTFICLCYPGFTGNLCETNITA